MSTSKIKTAVIGTLVTLAVIYAMRKIPVANRVVDVALNG